jgi:hypothetical protein
MNKKIEYIVRYDDKNKINTIYCVDRFNMQDLVDTLENNNISYIVIKLNNMKDYQIKWLSDFSDIFKEDEENE